MASKCKEVQIWPYRPWKITFRAIKPNLSFDMRFMSPQRSSMPKMKKSYWSVCEIDPSPPSILTDGRTDRRQTDDGQLCISKSSAAFRLAELKKVLKRFWDGPSHTLDKRTDRRTTDKSALEKLRCLSAGGAKNLKNTQIYLDLTVNWKVNWKIIHNLLYVFHTNVGHNMHRFWDINPNRLQRSKYDFLTLKNDL